METLVKLAPAISVLVAAAGFFAGVIQYGDQQKENRTAQLKEAVAQRETAERQYMQPWLESQREVYIRLIVVTVRRHTYG